MVAESALASGCTTATLGIAWSSVHCRSSALACSRARMPLTTITTAAVRATTPKMPNFRRETGGVCSVGMRSLQCGGVFGTLFLVYHTEYHGHKQQGCHGGKDQSADHGAAERGVLLAAFAEAQRHRRHADDHGQRSHQHRPETDKAGLDRSLDRIAERLVALAGEGDHQHAVGGGDAHAHDG